MDLLFAFTNLLNQKIIFLTPKNFRVCVYVFVCVRFVRVHTNKKKLRTRESCLYVYSYDSRTTINGCSRIVLVCILVRFSYSCRIVLELCEGVLLSVCTRTILAQFSYDCRVCARESCENCAGIVRVCVLCVCVLVRFSCSCRIMRESCVCVCVCCVCVLVRFYRNSRTIVEYVLENHARIARVCVIVCGCTRTILSRFSYNCRVCARESCECEFCVCVLVRFPYSCRIMRESCSYNLHMQLGGLYGST